MSPRRRVAKKNHYTASHRRGTAHSHKSGWLMVGISVLLIVGVVAGILVFRGGAEGTSGERPLSVLRAEDYHSLAFSPDEPRVVFFGHHDGIMRSGDGGKTWQRLIGRTNFDAMAVVVDRRDSRLLYLAGHDIFQVSRDGGVTWRAMQHDLPGTDIHAFVASPEDPNRLFAFVVGNGLFRSNDGGSTWVSLNTRLPNDVIALATSGGNPERLYAASIRGGVLRSTDGGQTWSSAGSLGLGVVMTIVVSPEASNTVYAGGEGGLYRSTDGGDSWDKLAFPGSNIATMAFSPAQPGLLMVIDVVRGAGQVYRSEDGGLTWGN